MTKVLDIKTQLREATERLRVSSESPQLDAELLFMHVLKKTRAFLYAHHDDVLEPALLSQIEILISKRLQGVPIAYLLGEREFWSLPLYVTEDTLIPRPETELLVELALELLGQQQTCSVLELGTGTGAIVAALASEKPQWHFIAVDQSEKALSVAEKNINRHGLKNINLIQSNWFEKVDNLIDNLAFDLVISNPPYLAFDDQHQYQGDLRFEPKSALLSGENGLDDLNFIIKHSIKYLRPGGLLLLEHGYQQAPMVTARLKHYKYNKTSTWQDTNQIDRVSGGWKPG